MRRSGLSGHWLRWLVGGLLAVVMSGSLGRLAETGVTSAAPRPFNTTLLMTSEVGAIQDSVVTDGKVIAWADTRGALFAHTLAEARETRLLDGPARRSQLALSNGTLIWVEQESGGTAIRGLRLGDGELFTVASGPGERNSPALSGDTVVWRDRRDGAWRLFGYDLDARREFPIAGDNRPVGAVSVAGATVVFEDYRSGHWNLTGYDLTDRREYPITSGPGDDTAPSVGAGAVAFVRRPAGKSAGAVVLRDLRSGAERLIVEGHLSLRPVLAGNIVVWEDWRAGLPNIYAFDRASSGEFSLTRSEQARAPAVAGDVVVWLSKGQFSSRVTAVRLVEPLPTDPQDPPTVTDPDTRYFPETKHTLSGAFRSFWSTNGGVERFGFPLTEAFAESNAEGVKRQVQYFERGKLEADPQDPAVIIVAPLGVELTQGRSFPTVAPFPNTAERVYIPRTQHSLGGWFKDHWEENGGLAAFGHPISEEVQENGRIVQYFERARFELRPNAPDPRNRVTLGQLGREALIKRGWLPPLPPESRGGE